MHFFHRILIFCFFSILFGCDQDENDLIITPPKPDSSLFDIKKITGGVTTNLKAGSFINQEISTHWSYTTFESIQLTKYLSADLVLQNEDTLDFGVWFIRYLPLADTTLLVLEDKESSNKYPKKWAFKSSEKEIDLFYKTFNAARIFLDDQLIEYQEMNSSFQVSAQTKLVNKEEKIYLIVFFSGQTYYLDRPRNTLPYYYDIFEGKYAGYFE